MLDSIVQISHAGLSDNVRRESLLYDLSKKPARWPSGLGVDAVGQAAGGDGDSSTAVDADDNGDGGVDGDGEEEHDPTLCCHCYASLLEQIDGDSRLADREALAYRDFIELLDGVSAEAPADTKQHAGPSLPNGTTKAKAGDKPAAAALDKTSADQGNPGDTREESKRNGGIGNLPPRPPPGRAPKGEDNMDRADLSTSPYAQALRIAEQTSVQLRTELRSLETQRGSLCARGSEAWAALSELAYARGMLGDECRELLQVSREVC